MIWGEGESQQFSCMHMKFETPTVYQNGNSTGTVGLKTPEFTGEGCRFKSWSHRNVHGIRNHDTLRGWV